MKHIELEKSHYIKAGDTLKFWGVHYAVGAVNIVPGDEYNGSGQMVEIRLVHGDEEVLAAFPSGMLLPMVVEYDAFMRFWDRYALKFTGLILLVGGALAAGAFWAVA